MGGSAIFLYHRFAVGDTGLAPELRQYHTTAKKLGLDIKKARQCASAFKGAFKHWNPIYLAAQTAAERQDVIEKCKYDVLYGWTHYWGAIFRHSMCSEWYCDFARARHSQGRAAPKVHADWKAGCPWMPPVRCACGDPKHRLPLATQKAVMDLDALCDAGVVCRSALWTPTSGISAVLSGVDRSLVGSMNKGEEAKYKSFTNEERVKAKSMQLFSPKEPALLHLLAKFAAKLASYASKSECYIQMYTGNLCEAFNNIVAVEFENGKSRNITQAGGVYSSNLSAVLLWNKGRGWLVELWDFLQMDVRHSDRIAAGFHLRRVCEDDAKQHNKQRERRQKPEYPANRKRTDHARKGCSASTATINDAYRTDAQHDFGIENDVEECELYGQVKLKIKEALAWHAMPRRIELFRCKGKGPRATPADITTLKKVQGWTASTQASYHISPCLATTDTRAKVTAIIYGKDIGTVAEVAYGNDHEEEAVCAGAHASSLCGLVVVSWLRSSMSVCCPGRQCPMP